MNETLYLFDGKNLTCTRVFPEIPENNTAESNEQLRKFLMQFNGTRVFSTAELDQAHGLTDEVRAQIADIPQPEAQEGFVWGWRCTGSNLRQADVGPCIGTLVYTLSNWSTFAYEATAELEGAVK